MDKKNYVKVQIDEKEFTKTILDFMQTLDENKVSIDNVTLDLVRKDGSQFKMDFHSFVEFLKNMTKEKK